MQRRVEEFLLKEKALKVSALLIFPGVIPIVLQAPLDDNASEKRALLETVRLFQTVSGIGCVYVNLHLYGVINMLFLHLLGLCVPISWRKRVHELCPIFRIGPSSSNHYQKVSERPSSTRSS